MTTVLRPALVWKEVRGLGSTWLIAAALLVGHAVLTTKTAQIVAGLEMASVKTLNAIQSTVKRQFQVAA